jgi:hypothetical protein
MVKVGENTMALKDLVNEYMELKAAKCNAEKAKKPIKNTVGKSSQNVKTNKDNSK